MYWSIHSKRRSGGEQIEEAAIRVRTREATANGLQSVDGIMCHRVMDSDESNRQLGRGGGKERENVIVWYGT